MSESLRIFVVETEPRIRKIVDRNLKLDGFEVFFAEDDSPGLEQAAGCAADLVLLDCQSGRLNCIELLRKIREDKNLREIPVFVLTEQGDDDLIRRAFAAGADDYICKPFPPRQLANTIRRKLEGLLTRKIHR